MTLIQLYEFLEGKNFLEEFEKWDYADKKYPFAKANFLRHWFNNVECTYSIEKCSVAVIHQTTDEWKSPDGKQIVFGYYEVCLQTSEGSKFICYLDEDAIGENYRDLDILKLIIFESNLPEKAGWKTKVKIKKV